MALSPLQIFYLIFRLSSLFHLMQATSPVRTLDELAVCEVAPFIGFPSISERRDMSFQSSSGSSSLNVAPRKCSNESIGLFGERHRHRCFVITARSRSFLYHQVSYTSSLCCISCIRTNMQPYSYWFFYPVHKFPGHWHGSVDR